MRQVAKATTVSVLLRGIKRTKEKSPSLDRGHDIGVALNTGL